MLLDTQAEPLARWQGEGVGPQLLAAWRALPIHFVGGVQVAGVARSGGRYRVETTCGQAWEVDQVVVAAGLATPPRLARSAGLAWQRGIAVDAASLRTSDPRIHALGDCITVDGEASRFIEPIARQARAIAAALCGTTPAPYEPRRAPVRLKTSSCPMTLH